MAHAKGQKRIRSSRVEEETPPTRARTATRRRRRHTARRHEHDGSHATHAGRELQSRSRGVGRCSARVDRITQLNHNQRSGTVTLTRNGGLQSDSNFYLLVSRMDGVHTCMYGDSDATASRDGALTRSKISRHTRDTRTPRIDTRDALVPCPSRRATVQVSRRRGPARPTHSRPPHTRPT